MNTKAYLTKLNGKQFIMFNAHSKLTVGQCNSAIFKDIELKETDKNMCVFKFFNVTKEVIKPLDRRTKEYRNTRRETKVFSAGELLTINNN